MADDLLLDSPGSYAAGQSNGDGTLPSDNSLGNLQLNFSPSLTNLLPPPVEQNLDSPLQFNLGSSASGFYLPSISSYSNSTSNPGDLTSLVNSIPNSITGFLENSASSLLNAFVVNPQNAQTAEQQATVGTELQAISANQIFTYLIYGLVIFLVFNLFTKK